MILQKVGKQKLILVFDVLFVSNACQIILKIFISSYKTECPSPDGSGKPFEIKWHFSWIKRATSGSSFLSLEKCHFMKKLETYSRIKLLIVVQLCGFYDFGNAVNPMLYNVNACMSQNS